MSLEQAIGQCDERAPFLHRRVVDAVEACILELDVAGTISFANRFAEDCFGRDLTGRSLWSLVDERARPVLMRAIRRASSGAVQRGIETRHESEVQRALSWTISPVVDEPTDGAAKVLAVGLDITDRLEIEQRGAERQAMAVMGALATRLAHEIRNPLNAAKLQLELLLRRAQRARRPDASEELEGPATLVRAEIERLRSMLDEFIALARPRLPVRTPLAVRAIVDEVIALEAASAGADGVTLRAELADAALVVRADAGKLKEILHNLIRNGIEALSGRAGEVVVSATVRPDGGVLFEVADDGAGLPDDLSASAAFQPFVTRKPAGTGLGLAIVQKNVAQHDGEVSLEARPEGGTVARFFISV